MAMRSKGFSCFSIDSVGHKGVPILRLNLLRENDLSILSELISKHVIFYAHFGPPCGTSSAARGIPVNGRPGPPKLRSMQHTMGLKSLTGKDKFRVLSANRLYEITVALIFQLHEAGAYWSVENPASSMMWVTTPFVRLQKCLMRNFVDFDAKTFLMLKAPITPYHIQQPYQPHLITYINPPITLAENLPSHPTTYNNPTTPYHIQQPSHQPSHYTC